MVKALLIVVIIVAAMALLGWLTFSNSSSQSTIVIDKNKVQQDTGKAVERVQEFTEDVRESVDKAVHRKEAPVSPAAP